MILWHIVLQCTYFTVEVEDVENEGEAEEGKSGEDADGKMDTSEANGQPLPGIHFLTEEEAETTDITEVSFIFEPIFSP